MASTNGALSTALTNKGIALAAHSFIRCSFVDTENTRFISGYAVRKPG